MKALSCEGVSAAEASPSGAPSPEAPDGPSLEGTVTPPRIPAPSGSAAPASVTGPSPAPTATPASSPALATWPGSAPEGTGAEETARMSSTMNSTKKMAAKATATVHVFHFGWRANAAFTRATPPEARSTHTSSRYKSRRVCFSSSPKSSSRSIYASIEPKTPSMAFKAAS